MLSSMMLVLLVTLIVCVAGTAEPTDTPTMPTNMPTDEPTTKEPTNSPSDAPTLNGETGHPSTSPTSGPTDEPTTKEPTAGPTDPTTAEPTTSDPTTAEPTTAEPTTAEPTTAEPTTAEPTTAEPTTAEPTTAEPTTAADPTTADPTTADPTTADPTTATDATNDPTATDATPEPTDTTSAPTEDSPNGNGNGKDKNTDTDATTQPTAEPSTPGPTVTPESYEVCKYAKGQARNCQTQIYETQAEVDAILTQYECNYLGPCQEVKGSCSYEPCLYGGSNATGSTTTTTNTTATVAGGDFGGSDAVDVDLGDVVVTIPADIADWDANFTVEIQILDPVDTGTGEGGGGVDSASGTSVDVQGETVFISNQRPSLISDVVRIEVLDAEGVESDRPALSQPVVLAFTATLGECQVPSCEYVVPSTGEWAGDGCTVSDGAEGEYLCTCTHLTDFALLAYEEASVPCLSTSTVGLKIVLIVFVVAYVAVMVLSLIQFVRACAGLDIKSINTSVLIQHALLFAVASIRLVAILAFLSMLELSQLGHNVLLALAHTLLFVFFSRLVTQWSAFVHAKDLASIGASSGKQKIAFYIANLAVTASCVVLFVAAGRNPAEQAVVGSVVLAVVWSVVGLVFCFYARGLARVLGGTGTSDSSDSRASTSISKRASTCSPPKSSKSSKQALAEELTRHGIAVVVCLVLQSACSVFSVVFGLFNIGVLATFTALYLLFDCAALLVGLLIYATGIKNNQAKALMKRMSAQELSSVGSMELESPRRSKMELESPRRSNAAAGSV